MFKIVSSSQGYNLTIFNSFDVWVRVTDSFFHLNSLIIDYYGYSFLIIVDLDIAQILKYRIWF